MGEDQRSSTSAHIACLSIMSFVEKLDEEGLAFFNSIASKSYGEQAVAFLNAYWNEVHTQAEFIFTVAWEKMKRAEMHAKGISLLHQYNEGSDLDFDIGLFFYEQLCKFLESAEGERWRGAEFAVSQPEMMTALKRKQELREKVDVNFDGRVSFLEYLLYQYQSVANPTDFVHRSMTTGDEHPEIKNARLKLEEVNKRIRAYEAEKSRLEAEAEGTGVKALRAKNMLAQLDSSPLTEELNAALIQAEAAVRGATKKYGGSKANVSDGSRKSVAADFSSGAVWWLNRDLEEKQRLYGKKKKEVN
eukprot:c6864_g1_i1.p1 GENE.c6864_g1_i1~~c6864_g1_i1.p1  ORF type:complete len:303 (-),score=74.12 c6864_g1_i1:109-1017(-)